MKSNPTSASIAAEATPQEAEFVAVPCPMCNSHEQRFERTIEGFSLKRCRNCGLVFVSPQYTTESLMRIYQQKKDPEKLIALYARLATASVLSEYDRKLGELTALLGRKGRILDFACAAGYFVERAAANGWDAHGVDIGDWAREAAHRRGVANVHIGHLPELTFPASHFDVVNAAQVLEHLQSPLVLLAEIRRILKRGGILYVDVPNYRTLPIMMSKDDFYLNTPPQHINYFTPKTIRNLLKRAGFEVQLLTTEGGLKWENLIGRPIISDIANAYREAQPTLPNSGASSRAQKASVKQVVWPIVDRLLYKWAKVGINLVVFARNP